MYLSHKCAHQGIPALGAPVVAAQSRTPEKTLNPLSPADDVHGSHGRQVCRRHELYVSFQDLGWLVIAGFLSLFFF